MPIPPFALWMLEQEARAMLTRLARIRPFAMQETMLPAAGLLPSSQVAIESYLMRGRRELRRMVKSFLRFLRIAASRTDAATAQRRTTSTCFTPATWASGRKAAGTRATPRSAWP